MRKLSSRAALLIKNTKATSFSTHKIGTTAYSAQELIDNSALQNTRATQARAIHSSIPKAISKISIRELKGKKELLKAKLSQEESHLQEENKIIIQNILAKYKKSAHLFAENLSLEERAPFFTKTKLIEDNMAQMITVDLECPIALLKEKHGKKKTIEIIAKNPVIVSLTAHPTENRNLEFLKLIDSAEKLALITSNYKSRTSSKLNSLIKLKNLYRNLDLTWPDQETNLANAFNSTWQHIFAKLAATEVTLTKKRTSSDERDLFLFHIERSNDHFLHLQEKHPELITPGQFTLKTWMGDLDGKPHNMPKDGLAFVLALQQKFKSDLTNKVAAICDMVSYLELDPASKLKAENTLENIHIAIADLDAGRLYENKDVETFGNFMNINLRQLNLLLAGKTEQINLMHLRKLELFLQQTELRYLQSPFTLRQETMETNKVAAELLNMEYSQYEELETNKKIAQLKGLFEEPASNIETYIGKLTPHAQRELLWAIIALKVGADEHIISQYETYETIAALRAIYAVAEEFYSQPNAAEIFAKLLSAVPLELQENLFSGTLKMSAQKIKISPLPEEVKTITNIAEDTKAAIKHPWLYGNQITQVRSNSDGGEKFGTITAPIANALTAIEVILSNQKAKILAGIGNDQITRSGGTSTREEGPKTFTVQGSNMQGYLSSIPACITGTNPKGGVTISALAEKYPEELNHLMKKAQEMHQKTEQGFKTESAAYSQYLTKRGVIAGAVQKKLGFASSRPEARSSLKSSSSTIVSLTQYDDSVTKEIRRIGAMNMETISGMNIFTFAPFTDDLWAGHSRNFMADFTKVPMNQQILFNALLGLGCTDLKTYLHANTIPNLDKTMVKLNAKKYAELISLSGEALTVEKSLLSDRQIQELAICYNINIAHNALRNIMLPISMHLDIGSNKMLELIYEQVENGSLSHKEAVKQATTIASLSSNLSENIKKEFSALANRLTELEGPLQEKQETTIKAYNALKSGNMVEFSLATDNLYQIISTINFPEPVRRVTKPELLIEAREQDQRAAILEQVAHPSTIRGEKAEWNWRQRINSSETTHTLCK
ncbi:MAG: hypothetical protein HOH73_03810 [Alphaproteobacteria bacterium]|jgi:hypothetical protein|nr:hypothetical protein [Alphaproteobacteria bacterium]